jgi:hypothetical protein
MSFERGGEFGDALAAMRYAAMFQRGPIARATLTRIAYLQARVTQINAENARNYPAAPTPPPLASTPQPSIAGSLSGSAAAELQ